jgi:trans-aconitate 2-methyltransferase
MRAMAPDAWNPSQYERFRAERRQPFDDLVALVQVRPRMRVIDLGCGTGDLTAELHDRLAAAETVGLDRSPAMLERSAAHVRAGLRFAAGDVGEIDAGGAYDLVFSNATLHWLPDHPALFARLTRALAPGGQLAVQMPANFDHPAHATAREIAGEEPFVTALAEKARFPEVLAPEAYAVLLDRLGFAEQHVRLQVYAHRLATREEVVEWIRGTGLTAYESELRPELFAEFLARYRERLLPRLEDRRPFLYPFKRILLWGALP